MRESGVAVLVRLAAQRLGITLFRNTVGKFQVIDKQSGVRWIQAGLCVGSSDWIGFFEYTIRPEDVGRKIAVFTAIETKRSSGGRKSEEQKRFVDRVREAGGLSGFVNSVEATEKLVAEFMGEK